ncbi:hypothetical protein GCM10009038_33260 [Salinicola rhizosphaerae]|uniref:Uncharacterized protein n=1 Tax=Salinicola rhizosphaerae TaxID=1443141 RepID=A0ABQ3EE31_9GAMM|nr:hypothetical protein GCM10009038_33260 [Salinicola rhizosphaerae]
MLDLDCFPAIYPMMEPGTRWVTLYPSPTGPTRAVSLVVSGLLNTIRRHLGHRLRSLERSEHAARGVRCPLARALCASA